MMGAWSDSQNHVRCIAKVTQRLVRRQCPPATLAVGSERCESFDERRKDDSVRDGLHLRLLAVA